MAERSVGRNGMEGVFNPCYLAWSKLVVAEIHGARVCVCTCARGIPDVSSIRTIGRETHKRRKREPRGQYVPRLYYKRGGARTRVRIVYLVAAFCFPRSYRPAALRRRICDRIRRGRRDGALKMWHIAMKAYAFARIHPPSRGRGSENKVSDENLILTATTNTLLKYFIPL